MNKTLTQLAVIGLLLLCVQVPVLGQWSNDTVWKNAYLTDNTYKVLLNSATYNPGTLTYKLEVNGTLRSSGTTRAPQFIDDDNPAFYADPSSTSIFNIIRGSSLVDRDNTNYYVDPNSTSVFNDVRSTTMRASYLLDLEFPSTYYLDPNSNSVLNTLTLTSTSATSMNLSGGMNLNSGGIGLNQSSGLTFHIGTSGGNGVGYLIHNDAGFTMVAPGYGSDLPHAGGKIELTGGASEDYAGGDIIINAGESHVVAGNIFLDSYNRSYTGVGFSTATALSAKLDVNGSVRATSYITVSDGTLKTNIKPISGGLDKILKLKGTTYSFRESTSIARTLPKGNQIGFIAQDVEKVLPEAVTTDATGLKGVDYNKIIPVLVEAIKEQQQQIDILKNELKESRINSDASSDLMKKYQLLQNTPNPFSEKTTIHYKLTGEVNSASIYIYDMQGREIMKVAAPVNATSIEIQSGNLSAGMFFYSLLVDGKEIDTKRMILTK